MLMSIVKCSGYILAAVLILSVVCAVAGILVASFMLSAIFGSVLGVVVIIALCIKEYFESPETAEQPNPTVVEK